MLARARAPSARVRLRLTEDITGAGLLLPHRALHACLLSWVRTCEVRTLCCDELVTRVGARRLSKNNLDGCCALLFNDCTLGKIIHIMIWYVLYEVSIVV